MQTQQGYIHSSYWSRRSPNRRDSQSRPGTGLPGEAADVAGMRSLSPGSRFGGLIAWDSLFHLAPHEQRLMFPVFRGHALPDTPLLFTSGPARAEATGQSWPI